MTLQDRELVRALADVEDGLSEWEVEFVDHLAREARDQGSGWRGLSERQRVLAAEIAERVGA